MTKPYSQLANWYDEIKNDDFYQQYAFFIKEAAQHHNLSKPRILDIACGTGRLLAELAPIANYVAGLDISSEMLTQAQKRLPGTKLYRQDLRIFNIPEKFNTITCTFDSINYLLDPNSITNTFRQVSNHLDNNGLFIFDFNTVHKQASGTIQQGNITFRDRTDGSFWEVDIETPSGRERHREKLYTLEEMKSTLNKYGMRVESIYSDFKTKVDQAGDHPRLIIIAQKDTAT